MPSGTVAVLANAVSVVVTGAFGASYQVDGADPSWLTEVGVSVKTPTSFTLTFNTAVPAIGGQVDWSVNVTPPAALAGGFLSAGTIVSNVRDEIPDPVYDAADNPLPDANGLQRASTLYRWLNQGVKEAARLMGSILVEDWIAVPQVGFQPWYAIDPKWVKIDAGFSNQWPLDTITVRESDVIWPSTSVTTSQSLFGFYRKRAAQLEFGLWPIPTVTDPSTTLAGALTAGGPDPVLLTSTAGFLSYGYFKIEDEIVQYQRLSTAPAGARTISRGVCGTTAVPHANGTPVQHLGLWLKGPRAPATISSSLSLIELPIDVGMVLEKYLLARCRGADEEYDERAKLMKEFQAECLAIKADPTRKESAWQVRAFGEASVGPLVWGGQAIRP